MADSYFRGLTAITDVARRAKRLTDGLAVCGKPEAPFRLIPADFDLVKRWPKAAALAGFEVRPDGTVWFERCEVLRHVGRGRYE